MKKGKILKIAAQALWWAALLATAVLLVSVVGAKIRGQVPTLFGHSIMRIVTGSMEPQIQVGDYILVRQCSPQEIETGDIISFYSREYAIYGMPNTHRVVEITQSPQGQVTFLTKGDNNVIADGLPVEQEQLIGVYVLTVGWLTGFVRALEGGLLFVLLMVTLLGIAGASVVLALKKSEE